MNRRLRYASSIGKLKDTYVPPKEGLDELDAAPSIRDPLRRPDMRSGSSQGPMRRSSRKSSVAHMTLKGIGNLVVGASFQHSFFCVGSQTDLQSKT